MNNMIINTTAITKSYDTGAPERLVILHDINLSIEQNKISVIVGPSGAGKSTLLHLISGLDKPDSGTIEVMGKNITTMSTSETDVFRNSMIGFVFQFHHLLPEFSAEENIMIPLMIKGVSKQNAKKRSDELLEIVGLPGRKSHKPSELSGGEQQRIALARALANDPPLLFADEPTGNLDTENSEQINRLFINLRDTLGKTLVIVTHNKDLMAIADNTIQMKDGRII